MSSEMSDVNNKYIGVNGSVLLVLSTLEKILIHRAQQIPNINIFRIYIYILVAQNTAKIGTLGRPSESLGKTGSNPQIYINVGYFSTKLM